MEVSKTSPSRGIQEQCWDFRGPSRILIQKVCVRVLLVSTQLFLSDNEVSSQRTIRKRCFLSVDQSIPAAQLLRGLRGSRTESYMRTAEIKGNRSLIVLSVDRYQL